MIRTKSRRRYHSAQTKNWRKKKLLAIVTTRSVRLPRGEIDFHANWKWLIKTLANFDKCDLKELSINYLLFPNIDNQLFSIVIVLNNWVLFSTSLIDVGASSYWRFDTLKSTVDSLHSAISRIFSIDWKIIEFRLAPEVLSFLLYIGNSVSWRVDLQP